MTCKKVKFGTEAFALMYIAKLKKTSVRKVIPQETYLCPTCLTWHLTSRNPNELREKNRRIENESLKRQVKKLKETIKILNKTKNNLS